MTGEVAAAVDEALRVVILLLIDGAVPDERHAAALLTSGIKTHKKEVVACAEYLRDRVGVSRA